MIALTLLPGGIDVTLDNGSDAHAAVATVVYALLHTDQQAPTERVPDPYLARGWWADPQAGSGLWHVRQQALSPAARRETVSMIVQALSRAPALTGVTVEDLGAHGSASGVAVRIAGQHNGQAFLMDLDL